MSENIETFEDYLKTLCGDGETFICKACGFELPIEYRHEEAPEYCFMDFISEKDREFMDKVIAEVMADHGFTRLKILNSPADRTGAGALRARR